MEMLKMGDSLVAIKTEGMYLAIFDLASSANTTNKWNDSWALAKRCSAPEPYKQIFFFNDIWSEYARSSLLLTWVLNFDGIYRIHVVVSSESNTTQSESLATQGELLSFVGVEDAVAKLWVPSGDLVVGNLHNLGEYSAETMKVTPGLYKVVLTTDWEQQEKHQFLEDVSEYPEQDGPDYFLALTRLG